MLPLVQRSLALMLLVIAITASPGCQKQDSASPSALSRPDKRKSIAVKAKEALFKQLSGRLMSVMKSEGPVAAITVCSEEATAIAEAVGKEHGVQIGRTSFKLRNPGNTVKDWAKPLVEKRTETVQQVSLEDESLGVLFPIHINVKCLMCHGEPDDILDAVKPELAKRYPSDQATGFKLDELRGWFWVEVPAS